jgi:hypothetical protein
VYRAQGDPVDAESVDDARDRWVSVFSRDRADLGPGHAAAMLNHLAEHTHGWPQGPDYPDALHWVAENLPALWD